MIEDTDQTTRAVPLTDILRALPKTTAKERIALGEIVAALDRRTRHLVLLIFSVPAIVPTPGLPAGLIFGTALALIALQMMVGSEDLRLPKALSRRAIQRRHLEGFVRRALPWLERLGSRIQTGRWMMLVTPKAVRLIGLVVFLMGLIIALPIPFGNVLPGLAVLVIAIGLLEQDGGAVAAGLIGSGLAAIMTAGLLIGGYRLAETALEGQAL